MPPGYEFIHLSIEEAKQQSPNMTAVHIGVRHDDDFLVPSLGQVLISTNAGTDRLNHRLNFLILQNLRFATLVRVDNFTSQRQDRLKVPHSTTFC